MRDISVQWVLNLDVAQADLINANASAAGDVFVELLAHEAGDGSAAVLSARSEGGQVLTHYLVQNGGGGLSGLVAGGRGHGRAAVATDGPACVTSDSNYLQA